MRPPAISPITALIAGARRHADASRPCRVDLRRSGELLALVTTPRRLTDDRPDQRAFQAATPAAPASDDDTGAGDSSSSTDCGGVPPSRRHPLSRPLW